MTRRIVLVISSLMIVGGLWLVARSVFFDVSYGNVGGTTSCRAFSREVVDVTTTGAYPGAGGKDVVRGCASHARMLTILGAASAVLGVTAGSVVFRRPTLPVL